MCSFRNKKKKINNAKSNSHWYIFYITDSQPSASENLQDDLKVFTFINYD